MRPPRDGQCGDGRSGRLRVPAALRGTGRSGALRAARGGGVAVYPQPRPTPPTPFHLLGPRAVQRSHR